MNDDRAGRTLTCRTFVLVNPAAVIKARIAGEQGRIPVRIIVQHQQYLAFQILTLEIIPAIFRRLDAVADKHDFSILDRALVSLQAAGGDVLVPPFEGCLPALLAEGPLLWHLRFDAHDIEGLLPAAIDTARFGTDLLQLLDQIAARFCITGRRGSAALETISGECGDLITQVLRGDLCGGRSRRRRHDFGSCLRLRRWLLAAACRERQ